MPFSVPPKPVGRAEAALQLGRSTGNGSNLLMSAKATGRGEPRRDPLNGAYACDLRAALRAPPPRPPFAGFVGLARGFRGARGWRLRLSFSMRAIRSLSCGRLGREPPDTFGLCVSGGLLFPKRLLPRLDHRSQRRALGQ